MSLSVSGSSLPGPREEENRADPAVRTKPPVASFRPLLASVCRSLSKARDRTPPAVPLRPARSLEHAVHRLPRHGPPPIVAIDAPSPGSHRDDYSHARSRRITHGILALVRLHPLRRPLRRRRHDHLPPAREGNHDAYGAALDSTVRRPRPGLRPPSSTSSTRTTTAAWASLPDA